MGRLADKNTPITGGTSGLGLGRSAGLRQRGRGPVAVKLEHVTRHLQA